MPLAKLKPLIAEAEVKGYALGGFNILNQEMIEGVIEAGQALGKPVILNVHPDQIGHTRMEVIAAIASEAAGRAKIPVVLHLDYADNFGILRKAISCGFTSLMYVGSADLSFEDVIRETRIAAELAHSSELLLESEFKSTADSGLTDPVLAERFIRETGVDILSPQIGTSHGGAAANIDLKLLKEIKEKAKCYISLHGGSGVEEGIFKQAISLGINKASVYSQMSNAVIGRIKEIVEGHDVPDMVKISGVMKDAVKESVIDRLKVFSIGKENNVSRISSIPDTIAENSINKLIKDVTRQVLRESGKK